MPDLNDQLWAAAAQARLIAAGLCAGSVTLNRETPSQEDDLPTADIFISDDDGEPEGRGLSGSLEIVHRTKLCIDVRDRDNEGPPLRAKLAAHRDLVYRTLLPAFHVWAVAAEGCAGVRYAYVTPPEAGEVDGRVLIQIEILSRSFWSEQPVDDFLTMHVTTPVAGGDQPAIETEFDSSHVTRVGRATRPTASPCNRRGPSCGSM